MKVHGDTLPNTGLSLMGCDLGDSGALSQGSERHSPASCDLVCTSDESVQSQPPPLIHAMLSYVAGGFK